MSDNTVVLSPALPLAGSRERAISTIPGACPACTSDPGGSKKVAVQRVESVLQRVTAALTQADRQSSSTGDIPYSLWAECQTQFGYLMAMLHECAGDQASEPEPMRREIGAMVQRALAPYIQFSHSTKRMCVKPKGYAGDYLTIKQVYDRDANGSRPSGKLLDRCLLESAAARAVRNRRVLLSREIMRTIAENQSRAARVTSLACGPAEELFDTYALLLNVESLHSTLIDIDLDALEYVTERREREDIHLPMSVLNENLICLALGRKRIDLRDQDFVYSIGLIDYFEDDLVLKLLNFIHSILRPGGRVLLGNFHPRNSMKATMDYLLDWKLIHRSEQDMNRLYTQSAFGRPCTRIQFEDEGINLFAECVKPWNC